jgi:hypothetical protein
VKNIQPGDKIIVCSRNASHVQTVRKYLVKSFDGVMAFLCYEHSNGSRLVKCNLREYLKRSVWYTVSGNSSYQTGERK